MSLTELRELCPHFQVLGRSHLRHKNDKRMEEVGGFAPTLGDEEKTAKRKRPEDDAEVSTVPVLRYSV